MKNTSSDYSTCNPNLLKEITHAPDQPVCQGRLESQLRGTRRYTHGEPVLHLGSHAHTGV